MCKTRETQAPEKKNTEALRLIIDMQKDFYDNPETGAALSVYPRGGEHDEMALAIKEEVLAGAKDGDLVMFTADTHVPQKGTLASYAYQFKVAEMVGPEHVEAYTENAQVIYDNELKTFPRHCQYGSKGWALTNTMQSLLGALVDYGGAMLLFKPHYDLTTGHIGQGPMKGMEADRLFKMLKEVVGIKTVHVYGLITNVCVLAAVKALVAMGFKVIVHQDMVQSIDDKAHADGLMECLAAGAEIV